VARPSTPDLSGKVAVVTGAGSGIGRASALALAGHGAYVHGADIDLDAARRTAAEIEARGAGSSAHALDVRDSAELESLADEVFSQHGRVDVLHNNAGVGHAANIEATTFGDWEQVIGVNLLGVAYGVQAFVPRMLEQGSPSSVINTASMAGLVATAKMAPYSASKFGVVGLSEALDAELSGRGIRVSAVCPGMISTAIVERAVMRGDVAALQGRAARMYARRGTSPDVVAAAVLRTIASHRLIVPVPRHQVSLPYALHRISPRLTAPISRAFERLLARG